jgi:hypothetical protein
VGGRKDGSESLDISSCISDLVSESGLSVLNGTAATDGISG